MLTGRRLGPMIVLAIAVFAGQRALDYGLWGPSGPGSGLLPLICSGALMLLGVIDLVQKSIARPAGKGKSVRKSDDVPIDVPIVGADLVDESIAWRPVIIYVLSLVGFASSLDGLGFAVSAFLSMLLVIRGAEQRKWAESLLISGMAVAFGWLLFAVLLSVNLPRGRWLAFF